MITHRAIIRLSLQSFCYEGHTCYLCKQQICFLAETTDTNQFIRLFSWFVRKVSFIFSVQFIDLYFFNQFIRETSRIRSLAFGISYTNIHPPISVVLLSKAYFCDHLTAGIAGSNFAEDTDVRLWCFVYVVQVVASATSWSLVQRSPTGCVWSSNLKTKWSGLDFACCSTN